MTELSYSEHADKAVEILSTGAFLTTAGDGKINTMTIAWGGIGFMWGKPIFTVLVRPSRFTYRLIEKSGEFTVSLPFGKLQSALNFCGANSGRDMDKFSAAGITAVAGKSVSTPVVGGCGLYYECKVLYKQEMNPANVAAVIKNQCYAADDFHTMYFGEIVAAYGDK